MKTIIQRIEPWNTYDRRVPAKHWVAESPIEGAVGIVRIRQFVGHIPFVGVRVIAHEIEHLIMADFRSNDDHHDSDAWVNAGHPGEVRAKHNCGRSYSWRGFFSLRHLSEQSIEAAKELRRNGTIHIKPGRGSRLSEKPA